MKKHEVYEEMVIIKMNLEQVMQEMNEIEERIRDISVSVERFK